MINIKQFTTFIVVMFLASNIFASVAGTINVGLGASETEIASGEEVVFSFNGTSNADFCGPVGYQYFFPGGMLVGGDDTQSASTSPYIPEDITVLYPAAGVFNATLSITSNTGNCLVSNSSSGVTINVADAAIPTLGQWGLILLSILVIIFGVNMVRKSNVATS